ncbi:MAG: response regulator [Planctomycetes bacterium]|nr:response regulator [Planctomycetota bacterium]
MEGKTILLVEDNPDHQELTKRALRTLDILHFVMVVGDGQEALDYLLGQGGWSERDTRVTPAVVLLDLKLGRMDGFELLRRIRADERTKFVPVAILTSSREERDIVRSYAAGANSYIRKSLNFEEYCTALRGAAEYWLEVNVPPPGNT